MFSYKNEFHYEKIISFVVAFLVVVVVFHFVRERHHQRTHQIQKLSLPEVNQKIQDLNEKRDALTQLQKMKSLPQNWNKIVATTKLYNLKLETQQHGFYKGRMEAWHGKISGQAYLVMAALKELQKEIPLYLFEFTLNKRGVMIVDISVVGLN